MIAKETLEQRYEALLTRLLEKEDEEMLYQISELSRELAASKQGPDVLLDVHSESLKKAIKDLDPATASRRIMYANEVLLNGMMSYAVSFYGFYDALDAEKRKLEKEISERERAEKEVKRLNEELESRVVERTAQLEAANAKLTKEIENRSQIERAMKESEEKLKTEMEITASLLGLAEAIASITDVNRLMEEVVRHGAGIMKCDACVSYLWEKESEAFVPCQEVGLSHEASPVFRTGNLYEESGIVWQAIDSKKPLLINKTDALIGELSWADKVSELLIGPLLGTDGCIGLVIGIYSGKKRRGLSEREKKAMEGICNLSASAIEQIRLYRESVERAMELSRKIETIKLMGEIDRSILSTLNSEEIIETAVRKVGMSAHCDRATVMLVDGEKQGLLYTAGFGVNFIKKGAFVPFKETNACEVVKTRRPQYVNSLAETKRHLPFEKMLLKEGFLSHIRLPLTVKGDVVGVLNIGAKRASAYTNENLSTLEKLAAQISVALSNARLVSDLEELYLSTVKSLSNAIDAKSPWTRGHSERVTKYALVIAEAMEIDERERRGLEIAGLLHDIGKIGTYESILDKPGKLTEEEVGLIRQHPGKGAEILSPIRQLIDLLPAIKHHHESYDGNGYPDGLKGEEIPLFARILTVADTADAMGADRPYRKGRSKDQIMAEFTRCSGSQFDPNVVEVFLRHYPMLSFQSEASGTA